LFVPHLQAPLRQVLVRVGLQTAQAPPPTPQAEKFDSSQMLPLQHPAHPELVLHTQRPVDVQRWPVAQAAAPLQVQTPAVQLSPRSPQSTHAAPPTPHAPTAFGVHTPPEQQPLGQVVALQPPEPASVPQDPPSHRHSPPTQVAGAAQAGLPPHAQAPVAVHRSATAALQALQAPPSMPQLATPGALQVDPLQQPVAHERALQTQVPPTHCWPKAHEGPVPQAQAPLRQALARSESHARQTAPPVPQVVTDGVWHVEPLQQPLGQFWVQSGHTPPSQSPSAQLEHAPPADPHWALVFPGRQVLPLQHPLGQVLGSQRQVPATQV
jgi:hypothetical protein